MPSHRPRSRLEWVLITAILLVAALLRTHDLGNVPLGLEHDEVATWHMVDRVLQGHLTLYFEEGYGHEPLFNYLTAIPVALFGPNWLGLRLWAPWFGLLAVAATYALLRRMAGPLVALAGAGFQATTVWALFFNRLGLRLNQLPFLLCVTAYCFWRGAEATASPARLRVRLTWFAAAGALMGSTFYTYMSSRAVPLIFAAFALYLVARERWWAGDGAGQRRSWGQVARQWWPMPVAFAVAVLVMAPLVLYLLDRPADSTIPQREGQVDMPLQELRSGNPSPILENAWALLKMWNLDGERYWQLNVSHRPVFVEPVSGLLFWAGLLWALWHWRQPYVALLLLWTGFGMLPSLLTSEAPSWPRTMLASPAALALPGMAIAAAGGRLASGPARVLRDAGARAAIRWALIGLLVLSLLLTAGLTWRDLIVRWPAHPRVRYAFQSSLTEALRYLDTVDDASPVVAAGLSPHDMDPWTERTTLRRDDLSLRWVDTRSALLLPPAERARLLLLDITPLAPALADWAGLSSAVVVAQGEVVPRSGTEADANAPVYYDPAFTIYELDVPALEQRVKRATGTAYLGTVAASSEPEGTPYVGAVPASLGVTGTSYVSTIPASSRAAGTAHVGTAAASLEAGDTAPTFDGLVRLVGCEWLAPPRAGEPARLLTYWRALAQGPRSTVYGEPALRIFLHLLDGTGAVAAGIDVLGAAPDTWRPGDLLVQLHAFDAPPQTGTYALEVGWYIPPDGPRLPVDGIEAPDDRILLAPVEVLP